jgi:hypothetical protein
MYCHYPVGSGDATAEVIDHAREAGDLTEALLARRLQSLSAP